MSKVSAQEFADSILAPQYRQPLKTLKEALAVHGWAEVDKPECCGSPVEIRSFIGFPYMAQCATCRKFVLEPTGAPSFSESGASVTFPDGEKVDMDTDRLWIAATEQEVG